MNQPPFKSVCRIQLVAILTAIASVATTAAQVEITVSAASSLTDAFHALAEGFQIVHPDVRVRLNFGGSNHLQRQIEAAGGRGIDVFASAGAGPVEALIETNLVRESDRFDFTANEVVLVTLPENPAEIAQFDDLIQNRVERIAIGAEKVPVGEYARQALRHLNLLEPLGPKLITALDVRQVADYVARGEVDAGFIYATDAVTFSDALRVVAEAQPGWHTPIRYPVAVLATTPHRQQASDFVSFVLSAEGQAILARYGFSSRRPSAPARPRLSTDPAGAASPWTAMKLSLMAATGALFVVFPLGAGLGALLAKRRFAGREVLDALLTLPMILPPTVTGYYLIILLGANSTIGRTLESWFGIRITLSLFGAGIASAIIALPLMVKSARAAFESVDREYELASYALGKSRVETLLRVTLPLARNGLLAGAVLSFARAIGEFGATFMIAGLIPGKTMKTASPRRSFCC